MAAPAEPTWNQVKAVFEDQDKKLTVIAENVGALRSEFTTFKMALDDVAGDVKLLKPAVQKNTQDIEAIKATLDHHTNILEDHTKALERVEKRLDLAEAKPPS